MLKNESRKGINGCNVGNKEGNVLWNVKWRNISWNMQLQRYERNAIMVIYCWSDYLKISSIYENYKVSQLQNYRLKDC